jgi:large subunit ribosomal protein L6
MKLEVQLFLNHNLNKIKVSSLPFSGISNVKRKTIKATQGTTVATIKQLILETTGKFYKNLQFIGVGYRAFSVNNFNNTLFMLKLGFSHLIYFKVPKNSKVECQKFTRLFISGLTQQNTSLLTSTIRDCKKPEPYKGKGILYKDEKIILKKGKKV